LVKSKPFEYFILLLIAFSSVNLALDNPLNNPNSTLTDYLLLSDYVLTSLFICEGLLKTISQGFLWNGDGAYMKNGWNIIDFLVVIISVVSITVTGNKYKFVKIFRLLRILRPLRVVSKNKGLRIGIQALIVAIPRLFNVTIISLLFFIICGIIGVNYFKGTFYTCIFGP
jgi:voltage-dependent calcium channel T type alpha-1G